MHGGIAKASTLILKVPIRSRWQSMEGQKHGEPTEPSRNRCSCKYEGF